MAFGCLLIVAGECHAQSRLQFPSPSAGAPFPPSGSTLGSPGAVLGGNIQPFDPYALPGNFGGTAAPPAAATAPQLTPPPSSVWSGQTPNLTVQPFPQTPPPGSSYGPPPPSAGLPYGQPTGGPAASDPYYRGSSYATDWFNRGQMGPADIQPTYGRNQATQGTPFRRLFEDTGLRGTYLFGKEKDDLQLTEFEASTTAYFPEFLNISNGLRVTPGFVFHWLSGPKPPETTEVPGRLYSAYIDVGLQPQFNNVLSAEITARVGIYSDFQAFNSDSLRFLGTAVGVYRLSPQTAVKLGGAYFDRVNVKFLPAAGIVWTPNPETRWDIFFPAPKLSNYWMTSGNQQIWWYVGGEYGGGSWSIEREGPPRKGDDDRMDINDVRIYLGVEWWNQNRYYAFAELGYVFDRELVFDLVESDFLHVDDTFMVRGGVSW